MNPYIVSLIALVFALFGMALAAVLALESAREPDAQPRRRLAWLLLAVVAALLTVDQFFALELAVRTGLYDLRRAMLATATGGLLSVAVHGIRRNPGE